MLTILRTLGSIPVCIPFRMPDPDPPMHALPTVLAVFYSTKLGMQYVFVRPLVPALSDQGHHLPSCDHQ